MNWICGMITVPSRNELYDRTRESLTDAGFEIPHGHTFMDGGGPVEFDGGYTVRSPEIGSFGNWILGLTELFIRNPGADRYAMFEDDVLFCRNVRQYLEQCFFPRDGYLNLYTTEDNLPKLVGAASINERGWGLSKQGGRGALALVFNDQGMKTLIGSPRIVGHVGDRKRRHYLTDWFVMETMRRASFKEYTHFPSLVQHVGTETTITNRVAPMQEQHLTAPSFPGEDFNAMEFLNAKSAAL